MPINRRRWAGLIPVAFFASTTVGIAIAPRGFLSHSVYWLGVFWFGVIGAVLLGKSSTVSRIPRYTSVVISFVAAFLVIGSKRYPEASMLLYGLVGLFAGFGIRLSYFLYFETKWMFCRACGRDYWHMKKNGVWECISVVHSFRSG